MRTLPADAAGEQIQILICLFREANLDPGAGEVFFRGPPLIIEIVCLAEVLFRKDPQILGAAVCFDSVQNNCPLAWLQVADEHFGN